MKKFFKSKGFKIVADVLLGVVSPSLKLGLGATSGLVNGVKQAINHEKQANLLSENGGQGQPNWPRIIGYIVFIVLVILLIGGKIDSETFEYLLQQFKEF